MKTFLTCVGKFREGSIFTERGIAWMVTGIKKVSGLGKRGEDLDLITADVIVNYR